MIHISQHIGSAFPGVVTLQMIWVCLLFYMYKQLGQCMILGIIFCYFI